MKASHVLQALLLAGASLAAQALAQPPSPVKPRAHLPARAPAQARPLAHPAMPAGALADTDLLYCAQVYAEGGALLKADPDPGVRRTGRDAARRSRVLGAGDIDLLNEDPARHKLASAVAQKRLAAMPAAPLEARRLALRAAYVECRHLEATAPTAPARVAAATPGTAGAALSPAPVAAGPATGAPSALRADAEAMLDGLVPSSAVADGALPAGPVIVTPAAARDSSLRRFWRRITGGPAQAALPLQAPATLPAPAPAATLVADTEADELPALRPQAWSAPAEEVESADLPPPLAPATASVTAAVPEPAATPVAAAAPGTTRPAPVSPPARAAASLPARKPGTRPAPNAAEPASASASASPAARASVAASSPRPVGLGDADVLYCAQVYDEVASAVGDDHAEAIAAARDARERWRLLNERDYDLLNENPARHSRAATAARQRLAGLPATPGRARSVALRAAYEECRGLEERASAATTSASPDRVRMLANRRFCRDLMQSKLKVSPKLRAAFTPSELSALDEIEKIAAALAQPMPGAPLTLEQDREAIQLQAQLRDTLDLAVANRSDAQDPVVLALGQCHEDYVQGLLGGPDVLAASRADEAARTAATDPVAQAPVVRMADLGAVFHMREVTPAGNFDAIWFRRGQGNLYDGIWVQAGSGQLQRDVLELRGIIDGELTLYRQSYHGTYRARVRPDGTLAPGEASWFNSAAYAWGPLPAQHLRGGSLGALAHMREITPYGNYEGIWRQRGETGIYDVVWVFLPTGEATSDVLAVSGMARGQLIIRRLTGPGLFPLKRRADSAAYKDPVSGGKVPARWEVLPAQALRLGTPSR